MESIDIYNNYVSPIIETYIDKFGEEPLIIGMFWRDIEKEESNILKAIEDNKLYNEYELLSKEEQKHYDNGKLVF